MKPGRWRKIKELDELHVALREDEANRWLYAADPEFARSLGYYPPPKRDPHPVIVRWSEQQLLTGWNARNLIERKLNSPGYISGAFSQFR